MILEQPKTVFVFTSTASSYNRDCSLG